MQTVGLVAAACVLATFCMRSMLALRAFAVASNFLFIIYAAGSNLVPILLLHILLLPINLWSLRTIIGGRAIGALCAAGRVALGFTGLAANHRLLLTYIGY